MEQQLSNRTKTPVLAMLMLLLWLAVPARAEVAINETNFPDANFRAWVQANYEDASKPGYLNEAAAAQLETLKKSEVANGDNVTNLKGIEYFKGLTQIDWCMGNLTELDVTQNTALTDLYCYKNQLTELDVTNNTALKYLRCYSNQLTELDVSNNTALTLLVCHLNQLTKLDVTNNTALTQLSCYKNQLTELNVTNNKALKTLYCQMNKLTSLDLSNCTLSSGSVISNQTVAIGPVIKYSDSGKCYYYVSLEESIEGQPSFIDWVHSLEGTTSVPFDLSRVSWTSGCEVFHGTKQGAPRKAALSDGLQPDRIQGDVLLLDADAAVFAYEYDTKNANAGKMDVTVSWDPSEVVTAIDDVHADAAPVSVRYLNASGMSANEPWQGVNIVVTTLSDGSQTVTKVLK